MLRSTLDSDTNRNHYWLCMELGEYMIGMGGEHKVACEEFQIKMTINRLSGGFSFEDLHFSIIYGTIYT